MNLDLWTEFIHLLTTKSSISGLWVFIEGLLKGYTKGILHLEEDY